MTSCDSCVLQALLVTGGRRRDGTTNIPLDSTEVLLQNTWTYVAALPATRYKISATSFNNLVYVFGRCSSP